jgi:hypothetical protein
VSPTPPPQPHSLPFLPCPSEPLEQLDPYSETTQLPGFTSLTLSPHLPSSLPAWALSPTVCSRFRYSSVVPTVAGPHPHSSPPISPSSTPLHFCSLLSRLELSLVSPHLTGSAPTLHSFPAHLLSRSHVPAPVLACFLVFPSLLHCPHRGLPEGNELGVTSVKCLSRAPPHQHLGLLNLSPHLLSSLVPTFSPPQSSTHATWLLSQSTLGSLPSVAPPSSPHSTWPLPPRLPWLHPVLDHHLLSGPLCSLFSPAVNTYTMTWRGVSPCITTN